MKNNLSQTTRKIFKNKILISIITIIAIIFATAQYTSFVASKFDNSTPEDAIREHVYKENDSWRVLFIEVEEAEPTYEDDDLLGNEEYYRISPSFMHFYSDYNIYKLRKIGNHYYVVELLGYV